MRELSAAAEAKRRYDWDHTADMLAMMATLHASGSYQREDFHPLREKITSDLHLDDPGAEYKRLKAMGC